MKTPLFLIGSVFIFWGIITENIIIGLIIALILESSNFIKKKWDFSTEDFIKISDLNTIIFITSIVVIFLNYDRFEVILKIAEWLPVIFIFLLISQLYNTKNHIIIGTKLGKRSFTHKPLNIYFPYVAITLFSCASINNRTIYFYLFLFIFIAWSFFYFRSKRYSIKTFIILLVFIIVSAYVAQSFIQNTNKILRDKMNEMMIDFFSNKDKSPFKTRTGIGTLGKLKLSGKILLRVSPNAKTIADNKLPYLLKEASYSLFMPPDWNKKNTNFSQVILDDDENWILSDKQNSSEYKLNIIQYTKKKKGLLALPQGSLKAHNLYVENVETDSTGVYRFLNGNKRLDYSISFNPNINYTDNAEDIDLNIPKKEELVLKIISNELNFDKLEPMEIISTLSKYFKNNFKYTLQLEKKDKYRTALSKFLLERKAGHCEYFATATVLLLRNAGIHARYVTGYAISEKSFYDKNIYIIRARHGHAWAEANINGRWLTIDNTPSVWLNEEEKSSSFLEGIFDFFEFAKFKINGFLTNKGYKANLYLGITVIFLIVILILRIYFKRKNSRKIINKDKYNRDKTFNIIESDFLLIENEILKLGIPRLQYETFLIWINRIDEILKNRKEDKQFILFTDKLIHLIQYHNKLRFDPLSLSELELVTFSNSVKNWINQWNQNK